MVEYLEVGMKLHAMYKADGEFYPAEIVQLGKKKGRPVKAGEGHSHSD